MKHPDWSGQTAVVLASGHSLTAEVVAFMHGAPKDVMSIAVNSTVFTSRVFDVCYGGDFLWWKTHHKQVDEHTLATQCWTQDRAAAERFQLRHWKGVNRPGLGHQHIHMNGNSGFQAINLAFLFGSRRILLLGFDMRLGPNGEKHHHPDHPKPCVQAQTFGDWVHKAGPLAADLKAAGCEVVNCTPGSALDCFPKSTIEKELT